MSDPRLTSDTLGGYNTAPQRKKNVRCVREGIQKGDADETIENFAEALESFSRMN